MTLPSHQELATLVAEAEDEARALARRVGSLSLLDVLVCTRARFPDAAFVAITLHSGTRVWGAVPGAGNPIFNRDGERVELTTAERDAWRHQVADALIRLDTPTTSLWMDYSRVHGPVAERGGGIVLDLDAIEDATDELWSPATSPAGSH